jgi:hypothetical protein
MIGDPLLRVSILFSIGIVACASQPRISGHTEADVRLSNDIVNLVTPYGKAKLNCPTVDTISPGQVPADFVAPPIAGPPRYGETRYELWRTAGCKRSAVFLIQIWKDPGGGSFYAVSPYPAPNRR